MERFTFPLLSLFLLFVTSCDGSPQQDQMGNGQYGYTGQQQAAPGQQGQPGNMANTASAGEKVIMHPFTDPTTGMVSHQVPYPASWKVTGATQGNVPAVTGPGGVQVYYWSGESFSYPTDPMMQQSYQMAGVPMRAPVDISTYVQQDVAQFVGKNGLRLVKQYPLPQVAASSQAYGSQLYHSEPSRDYYSAMGTEWTNAKGESTFMVVNMRVSESQSLVFWNTSMQLVSAEKGTMASAQAALVNSIVNTQYNPQNIAAFNADQQRKHSQSLAQQNAQRQEAQRHTDYRQKLNKETQDYVNKTRQDANTYRQEVNDGLQHKFSNYINDENTVRDNNTGERYQVETGANQYWMNNNQEYIKSNDVLYDPNKNQNTWDQQWQEVEVEP